MALERKNGEREGYRWYRFRGWRKEGCGWYPVGEEITELGNGRELIVVDDSSNVFYVTRQKVEHMEYAVGGGNGGLGKIAVGEFDCIREKNMLGYSINHVEASVVLEHRANVETLTSTGVP